MGGQFSIKGKFVIKFLKNWAIGKGDVLLIVELISEDILFPLPSLSRLHIGIDSRARRCPN